MTTDFITALSGVQVNPLSPAVASSDPDVERVLLALGLRSESFDTRIQRALQLYRIVQASPYVSQYVEDNIVVQDYTGRLPAAIDDYGDVGILQTASGPGRVLPAAPADLEWPYPDVCTLERLTQNTALFSCGAYRKICTYNTFSGTNLAVAIPEEFGIRGNIKLTDIAKWERGEAVRLPLRFQYPAKLVVQLLKSNSYAYSLLERYSFAADFYNADRPEECIALVSVALYRELIHG